MNSSNIIILMLGIALILLAAGLVLYPTLTVTLNSLLTTTVASVASVAAVTTNPCPDFDYFEGFCYKVVKVKAPPNEKSCFSVDPTVPPSILASVNNATAIARVQRYINSKDVPANYFVNLFFHPSTIILATSDGTGFSDFIPGQQDYLAPYVNPMKIDGTNKMVQMKYNGGQAMTPTMPAVKDSLLCEKK